MADAEKPKPPESPTTARELDFDDDDEIPTSSPKPKQPHGVETGARAEATEAQPPSQPVRAESPREQAETTLREAFPGIDASVVKAVLTASNGQVEPAFNALLGMSDPDAARHDVPPPQPPRPEQPRSPQPRSQVEADEAYARRLAEHYQHQDYARSRQQQPRPQYEQQGTSPNQQGYYEGDRERSFIDDDLPVIRDNIRKGFLETQTKFNTFFTNLKKQIDGEDEEDPPPPPPRRPTQPGGADYARRSGDHARYDADPQVLGDDFTALQLKDETAAAAAAKQGSGRPAANPDLFKPTPARPQGQSGARVSFQEGPPEDINEALYRASPPPTKQTASPGNKNSKWQPLTSVEPDPVAEHDPFSLGDSDEEDAKKKDQKQDDTERLKLATAEAMSDELGSGKEGTAKTDPQGGKS